MLPYKIDKILALLFVFNCFQGYSQDQEKDLNLNRFFIDFAPTFGMYKPLEGKSHFTMGGISYLTNVPEYGGGLEFKTGNNWYLRKGKFCGLIQLTWIRLGFLFSDGLYSYASPANLGIGHHFQLNNRISISPTIQSGILFILDDPFN